MYEIQGERVSYETLPPASQVLTGGVVGQEAGRLKIQKNSNRRKKSPTIKNYKILYSEWKIRRF
jgi:hypothetical protein